jgi:hypothetical protein
VIRIYAGNVDLKANFKTIAYNRDSDFDELLKLAIKKFKCTEGEFYLALVHFDSRKCIP